MKCDPDKSHRRPLRLKEYDYRRAGVYFVTICTKDRVCWFGDVVDGKIRSNPSGDIVSAGWHDLPNHYPRAQLDAFVIMPNHVHGIARTLLLRYGVVFRRILDAGLHARREPCPRPRAVFGLTLAYRKKNRGECLILRRRRRILVPSQVRQDYLCGHGGDRRRNVLNKGNVPFIPSTTKQDS